MRWVIGSVLEEKEGERGLECSFVGFIRRYTRGSKKGAKQMDRVFSGSWNGRGVDSRGWIKISLVGILIRWNEGTKWKERSVGSSSMINSSSLRKIEIAGILEVRPKYSCPIYLRMITDRSGYWIWTEIFNCLNYILCVIVIITWYK